MKLHTNATSTADTTRNTYCTVLYTDMNTDSGANINITIKRISLIQIELPTLILNVNIWVHTFALVVVLLSVLLLTQILMLASIP